MTPKHEKIYFSNRKRHLIAKIKNIMIYLESIDVKTKAYIFGSNGTNGCFNTNICTTHELRRFSFSAESFF